MSLDVYLVGTRYTKECYCGACGHTHTATMEDDLWSRNITHNLNEMARQAGLYDCLWRPDENAMVYARDLIAPMREGLARLRSDPTYFKKLNPENGWGDYDGLIAFVEAYLTACLRYPNATIKVSR